MQILLNMLIHPIIEMLSATKSFTVKRSAFESPFSYFYIFIIFLITTFVILIYIMQSVHIRHVFFSTTVNKCVINYSPVNCGIIQAQYNRQLLIQYSISCGKWAHYVWSWQLYQIMRFIIFFVFSWKNVWQWQVESFCFINTLL